MTRLGSLLRQAALRAAFGALAAAPLALPAGPAAAADPSVMRLGQEVGGPYSLQVLSWKDIPFRTVVRQQWDFSCGAAAVATLLRYQYGRPTTEDEVFQAMWRSGDQDAIRKLGFSMLDMKRFLVSQGYAADGYKMTLDDLERLHTPAIVMIQIGRYRHFVTVKGVHADQVLVGDPALGLLSIERPKFQAIWNGIVLAVHDRPAGTPAPKFDDPSEWNPWALAPTRASLPSWAASQLMALPPLYQITPQIVIDLANPVANVP